MTNAIIKEFGGVDIVVNAAGKLLILIAFILFSK